MPAVNKQVPIAAPIEKVWAALAERRNLEDWMGKDSVAELDFKVGGRYAVFGGGTTGKFTAIEKPHTLGYAWRQSEWPGSWADSVVSWALKAKEGGTDVTLTHDQFPSQEERDGHDAGWGGYWLGPMKDWLEKQS